MTFERELVQNVFISWRKCTHLKYDKDGSLLASRVLHGWKSILIAQRANYHERLEAATTYAQTYLLKSFWTAWFKYSRARGKRMRLMSSCLRNWKDVILRTYEERRMLAEIRRRIQISRAQRCLMQWRGAMRISLALYCTQIQRFTSHVQSQNLLYYPPPLVEKSSCLELIYYWKKWKRGLVKYERREPIASTRSENNAATPTSQSGSDHHIPMIRDAMQLLQEKSMTNKLMTTIMTRSTELSCKLHIPGGGELESKLRKKAAIAEAILSNHAPIEVQDAQETSQCRQYPQDDTNSPQNRYEGQCSFATSTPADPESREVVTLHNTRRLPQKKRLYDLKKESKRPWEILEANQRNYDDPLLDIGIKSPKKKEVHSPKRKNPKQPEEHNQSNYEDSLLDTKEDLRSWKADVDETIHQMEISKQNLKKAQTDVSIQERAIIRCTREINHHCCMCGGIHVFSDHKPMQRKGCSRLRQKNRSLMYLKQSLTDASLRLNVCQVVVKESTDDVNEAKAKMANMFEQNLTLLESLQ